jgi:hypothetical protein
MDEAVNLSDPLNPTPVEYTDSDVEIGLTYHYWIWAYDDESPPRYSAVPGHDSAMAVNNFSPTFVSAPTVTTNAATRISTLAWSTSETVTSTLEWGTTIGYYGGSVSLAAASSFSYDISGLPGSTPIYYRVVITDDFGATATDSGSFLSAALSAADDADGDGMLDTWEITHFGDTTSHSGGETGDDGDLLTALDEYRYGTNPNMTDTDGDGKSDSAEVNGTPPSNPLVGVIGRPLAEDSGGCGSGGRAPLAWALVLAAAAMLIRRRRAAAVLR